MKKILRPIIKYASIMIRYYVMKCYLEEIISRLIDILGIALLIL